MNNTKNRIFTFGCSFTSYCWPTWADMLLYGNNGKNYGISGSGFDQILSNLIQCDIDYTLTPDDIIIIVYPNLLRCDLPFYPIMMTHGNVFTSKLSKYQNELWTIDGLIYKNSNIIYMIDEFLQNKKVNYKYSAIFDIFEYYENYFNEISVDDKLKNYIKKIQKKINMLTNFAKYTNNINDWKITKEWNNGQLDKHPRPLDHYNWLTEILLPTLDINININININTEIVNHMEREIDNFVYYNDSYSFFKQYFENRIF